jgi:hypothetical protein
MVRDPAGIVRATAQAAQRRDQIVRLLPAGFPGRLLGFRGTTPHGGIQTREPRFLSLPCHEPGSERVLGCVLIVGAAPEAQAIHVGHAAASERLDMVELEEAAGRTPMSVRADERAPATIALPHRAPDPGGDIACPLPARPLGTNEDRAGFAGGVRWSPAGAQLQLLEPRDQRVERAIEHLRHVAGRNRMAEQGLGMTKLVVGAAVDGDPHEVALGTNMPWGMFTRAGFPINMPRGMFMMAGFATNMPWGMFTVVMAQINMPWGMFTAVMIHMPRGMFVEQTRIRDFRPTDPGAHGLDDRRGYRRPKRRESARQVGFDLRLASMRRGLDQLARVLRRDVRCQEPHRGEMHPAFRERVEKRGNPSGGAGRMDALRGRVFGEPKTIDAIGEHGRAALRDVRAPEIDLGDVRQEHRCEFSVSSRLYRQST